MKNVCITEAETVNTGTKFIIRDLAQQVGERIRETVCSAEIEARQRGTPGEKGCGRPPSEEKHSKAVVTSFI